MKNNRRENHNRGCGTFAMNEILKHAFMNMNLNCVELSVLEDNSRARHVYEKAGFIQGGIKRKTVFLGAKKYPLTEKRQGGKNF